MHVSGCTDRVTVAHFSGMEREAHRALFIHRLYDTGVAGEGDLALQIAPHDADNTLQAVYVGERHYPVFAKRLKQEAMELLEEGGGRMEMSVHVQRAIAIGSSCAVCGSKKPKEDFAFIFHPFSNIGRPWIHPDCTQTLVENTWDAFLALRES